MPGKEAACIAISSPSWEVAFLSANRAEEAPPALRPRFRRLDPSA